MKKRIVIAIIIFVLGSIFYIGQRRTFYALGKDNYITVWKRYGGTCYIVEGKYYGIVKPWSRNMIEVSNLDYVSFFYSKEKPTKIIVQNYHKMKIINQDKAAKQFVNYDLNKQAWEKVLYPPGAKKVSDLKNNASIIDLDIGEMHASDKNGKTL